VFYYLGVHFFCFVEGTKIKYEKRKKKKKSYQTGSTAGEILNVISWCRRKSWLVLGYRECSAFCCILAVLCTTAF